MSNNYENMSDEEFMNASPPEDIEETVEQEEEELEEQEEGISSTDEEEQEQTEEKEETSDEEVESEAGEDEEDADEASDESESADDDVKEEETKQPKGKSSKAITADKAPETKEIDYKAEYERITAPFKANGRDIRVDSVDDAITLMKMGANYNKNMAAIKPARKALKLLENHGLMDVEKLSFLIELNQKKPEAIHKLIKDAGIDPMDHDPDKAGEYKPEIHSVSDTEIELDTVLDEITGSSTYNRTLGIISKEWDGKSKQIISDNPQLIKVINDHMERGIYDIIHQEVEREKMLGRLSGMSDLEAYRYVGDHIQARGGFDHLGSSQGNKTAQPKVITPKARTAQDDKLKDKKRAASSSKPGTSNTTGTEPNYLAMSDEEFEKLAEIKYR